MYNINIWKLAEPCEIETGKLNGKVYIILADPLKYIKGHRNYGNTEYKLFIQEDM